MLAPECDGQLKVRANSPLVLRVHAQSPQCDGHVVCLIGRFAVLISEAVGEFLQAAFNVAEVHARSVEREVMVADVVTPEVFAEFQSMTPEGVAEIVDELVLSDVAALGELVDPIEAGKRNRTGSKDAIREGAQIQSSILRELSPIVAQRCHERICRTWTKDVRLV